MLSMLGSVKVLVGKDDLRDYRGAGVKRITVTGIECISADGRSLRPLIIWPASTHRSFCCRRSKNCWPPHHVSPFIWWAVLAHAQLDPSLTGSHAGASNICIMLAWVRSLFAVVPTLGSSILLHADEKRTFTLKMTVGVTMALIGFCMYSHTKIKQPQKIELPVKSPTDHLRDHDTESLLQEQHKGVHRRDVPSSPTSVKA